MLLLSNFFFHGLVSNDSWMKLLIQGHLAFISCDVFIDIMSDGISLFIELCFNQDVRLWPLNSEDVCLWLIHTALPEKDESSTIIYLHTFLQWLKKRNILPICHKRNISFQRIAVPPLRTKVEHMIDEKSFWNVTFLSDTAQGTCAIVVNLSSPKSLILMAYTNHWGGKATAVNFHYKHVLDFEWGGIGMTIKLWKVICKIIDYSPSTKVYSLEI